MATEFRLGDDDRKKYCDENTPEWVTFDAEALSSTPFDVQHPWEQEIRQAHPEMGLSLVKLLAEELGDYTALGIKSFIWIAWKMAGIDTPRFKDFNIQTLKAKYRDTDDTDGEPAIAEEDEDAVPPADGSSENSLEQTPS